MITRKGVVEEMTKLCFVNQFMLYLKLEEMSLPDYDILGKVMVRNNNLEFKHIVFLILHGEIKISKELTDLCNKNFKWCYDLEHDFDYKP